MAIAQCPECGKRMSTTAKACPACGFSPGKATAFWLKLVGGLLTFGGVVGATFTLTGEGSDITGAAGVLAFVAGLIVFMVGRFKE